MPVQLDSVANENAIGEIMPDGGIGGRISGEITHAKRDSGQ